MLQMWRLTCALSKCSRSQCINQHIRPLSIGGTLRWFVFLLLQVRLHVAWSSGMMMVDDRLWQFGLGGGGVSVRLRCVVLYYY
jgi:hypothetical protein